MQAIDGDKSAARDIATRQKIASFPPEIHDPALLSQVKGKKITKLTHRSQSFVSYTIINVE